MTEIDADDDDPTLWIIQKVREPIKARRNNVPIEKPGVDLASYEESLRSLIRRAEWAFQQAKDDLEPRLAGYKRKLSENTTGVSDELVGREYDYSDLGSDGVPTQQEWEAHYDVFHKRGPGKPSTNQAREGGPRPVYLHGVYILVEGWWEEQFGKGSFKPVFGGADPYEYANFNASARLLHLIIQQCEPLYTLANTANLPRTLRDERKKPSNKNRP